MSAEGWANVIAALALIGSAMGFWLNRRDISNLRHAAAEVRWGLSEEILERTKGQHGIPRKELNERATMLRWWLTRLRTPER